MWRLKPEEQYSERATDLRQRPSVDMLVTKMRKLSNLQNNPDVVRYLIDDLLHHYFMVEKKRPASLFQVCMSAMYKFQLVTGGKFEDYDTAMLPPEEAPSPSAISSETSGGEAPQPMGDSFTKKGVEEIIANHVYRYDGNICNCGRPYPTHKEWATHLRIRVQRYLENEFKGDA